MKAKRKSDGKVIEVTERASWNGETIYTADGTFYRKHELEIVPDDTPLSDDAVVTISKLREVLMDMAMPTNEFRPEPTIARTIEEIINQIKLSI
ncbi:MAG: hypothetical protein K2I18_08695 [Paramuribaculum sp.]|nr:hypothetical protein [Paramuribaculum sp.]